MKFSRRSFLQGVTTCVASYWGWENQSIFSPSQLNAYAATLNQGNCRKLALLVGINRYPLANSLKGCQMDVELQKELLIYRFGFQPQDIVTLTDEKATKENIITTFNQHFQSATKDDVVVFHFSGYGRQLRLSNPQSEDSLIKSLITYDSIEIKNQETNDLFYDTLINLAENLKTKKYSLILDTSFTPPATSIEKQISLRGYQEKGKIPKIKASLNVNQKVLGNSTSVTKINPKTSVISGLVLTPNPENIAIEINSDDFQAGLFTYTLTQSLWIAFDWNNNTYLQDKIATIISLYSNQPTNVNFFPANSADDLNYNLPFLPDSQGIGFVLDNTNGTVKLKLLGLPLLILLNYGSNSIVTTKNKQGENISIQINSISGNIAKGTIIEGDSSTVESGLIVRESTRVIPAKIGLNIGLNNNLTKIEKVDATSALSTVDVAFYSSTIGNNFVDYILDKSHDDEHQGYSLFSPTGTPLTYTNPTSEHEGIYSAVKRLEKFMYLDYDLACKLLNLTYNEYSSLLPVNTTLKINADNFMTKIDKYTATTKTQSTQKNEYNDLITIPQNSSITVSIDNQSQDDLYCFIFEINASKEVLIYNNPDFECIKAGKSKCLPDGKDNFKWFLNSNKGLGQLIVICAKSPFEKTVNMLNKNSGSKLKNEQIILLKNSVNIAQSLLEDLHFNDKMNNSGSDFYALNMNNWVTFSFVYQIN